MAVERSTGTARGTGIDGLIRKEELKMKNEELKKGPGGILFLHSAFFIHPFL
jgi:hypothetical protein